MKLIVIGGSNSKNSINRKLALFTASLFNESTINLVNLSEMDIPLFSVDLEVEIGIPALVLDFAQQMDDADGIVLSLAENNSSFNAGFKNLMDWTSRIKDRKIFGGKPMLIMATSPGARGGMGVLEHGKAIFPYWGATVKGSFSLPSFSQNFDDEKGITHPEYLTQLQELVQQFEREVGV